MKKIKIKLTVLSIFTLFVFPSCKKDYSCKCTDAGSPVYVFTIHDSKANAQKQCGEKIYGTGYCTIQ